MNAWCRCTTLWQKYGMIWIEHHNTGTGFTQEVNEPSKRWNLSGDSQIYLCRAFTPFTLRDGKWQMNWNLLCFFFTGNGGGCSLLSPKKSARRGSIKLWCLFCMALNIMLLKLLLCLKVSMCTLRDPTAHQRKQPQQQIHKQKIRPGPRNTQPKCKPKMKKEMKSWNYFLTKNHKIL